MKYITTFTDNYISDVKEYIYNIKINLIIWIALSNNQLDCIDKNILHKQCFHYI